MCLPVLHSAYVSQHKLCLIVCTCVLCVPYISTQIVLHIYLHKMCASYLSQQQLYSKWLPAHVSLHKPSSICTLYSISVNTNCASFDVGTHCALLSFPPIMNRYFGAFSRTPSSFWVGEETVGQYLPCSYQFDLCTEWREEIVFTALTSFLLI